MDPLAAVFRGQAEYQRAEETFRHAADISDVISVLNNWIKEVEINIVWSPRD